MKVRIRGNTIRFRLGQNEVDLLRRGERVVERIVFDPENRMEWSIEVGPSDVDATISAAPGLLRIVIPNLIWLEDETIEGYRTTIESAPGHEVGVAVERDYSCLKPRDSVEDRDSFPHPEGGC